MADRRTTVAEVMTKTVLTLAPDDDLKYLEESMRLFRFRHMPVVDEGKIVGLVSHRDVLRASASVLMPHSGQQNEFLGKHFHVRDIMSKDVQAVGADTPIVVAARLMDEKKLGCVLVTDKSDELVGIVTEADFVNLAISLLEG